ncbi:hypothetical protein PYCCODRAFT_1434133 [Trametes coccinea BRFM310]|uniref:Protein kinase domain-containing protein n=1 Tax=Trametes coccinea (strain BRFM310) TaxID=1353009 RepID=A0A1Y2IRJ5_TRAC3|nr:hypothetical protein PYCCODRAFT_1434133 [Trametes coccinea BRFM310]
MSVLYWPKCATSANYGPMHSDTKGHTFGSCSPLTACDLLQVHIPNRDTKLPLRIRLNQHTLETSDGNRQIFRAELCEVLLPSGRLTTLERDVICKVAYGQRRIDDLLREADFYNTKLLSLQGTVVPRMHGCYQGNTEDGRTAVLILEYCGEELAGQLQYYHLTVRTQAVQALFSIHKAGLLHNNFDEGNIVVSRSANGGPRLTLIDFDRSVEHTCPSLQEVDVHGIVPYARMPGLHPFQCKEIRAAVQYHAEIWFPRSFYIFDKYIPEEYTTSVEAVLDFTGIPSGTTLENARSLVQAELDRFAKTLAERLAMDNVYHNIEKEMKNVDCRAGL